MSSGFADSDEPPAARPFDDDGHSAYDDIPPASAPPAYVDVDVDGDGDGDGDGSLPSPSSIQQGLSSSPEVNGMAYDGPILPPPTVMETEESFMLREWRRQNALELQEKERRERELVKQIREEAEEYKIDFQRRSKISCETKKANNREKEKLSLENQAKFHAEADKNYWKAIAELIPHELPSIEKKKGKKDEKKPAIVVTQGPKPGKPTDLSRMRHILRKLTHSPPLHMKLPPAAASIVPSKDDQTAPSALPKGAAVAAPTKAVAVA